MHFQKSFFNNLTIKDAPQYYAKSLQFIGKMFQTQGIKIKSENLKTEFSSYQKKMHSMF